MDFLFTNNERRRYQCITIRLVYNDEFIRQIIEVVIVESKEKIKIIFKGGLTVKEKL